MRSKFTIFFAVAMLLVASSAWAGWLPADVNGIGETIIPLQPDVPTAIPDATSFKVDADIVRAALEVSLTEKVVVTDSVVATIGDAIVEEEKIVPDAEVSQKLPLFSVILSDDAEGDAEIAPLESIYTMYPLDASFRGKKVSDIMAVKVKGTSAYDLYTYAPTATDVEDKTFSIIQQLVSGQTRIMIPDDIIGDGDHGLTSNYYVALCVMREGDFDLGLEDTFLIDPAFVMAKNPPYPSWAPRVENMDSKFVPIALTRANLPHSAPEISAITQSAYGAWLEVKDEVIESFDPIPSTFQKLPVFSVAPGTEKVAVVAFSLDATKFNGKNVSNIGVAKAIAKVGSTWATKEFEMVGDIAEFGEGKAAIIMSDGVDAFGREKQKIVPLDGKVQSSGEYYVMLGILDGGDCDLATADGVVLDPAFVFAKNPDPTPTPTPTPTPEPDPDDPIVTPVVPEIPAEDLPKGVEIATVTIPAAIEDSGLGETSSEAVEAPLLGSTHLVLKDSVVSDILKNRLNTLEQNFSVKMPVFKGTVSTEGTVGLFMFELPSSFAGKRVDLITPVKAVSSKGSESKVFGFVSKIADLEDGKFAVLDHTKSTPVPIGTKLLSGKKYYVLLAIRDRVVEGKTFFDQNVNSKEITDPLCLAIQREYQGTSGGCNAMSFAPGLLVLAAPLLLLYKKK